MALSLVLVTWCACNEDGTRDFGAYNAIVHVTSVLVMNIYCTNDDADL